MRILGVDPSLRSTGFALLDLETRRVEGWLARSSPRDGLPERLHTIARVCESILEREHPDRVVVEAVIFHRNPRTALVMGAVRGALLLTCARAGFSVEEISPTRAKRVLTGYGQASKEQVARMIAHVLGVDLSTWPPDLTDALALAAGFALQEGVLQ